METHARSIAKAVSYRLMGSIVTFSVAYAFTRQMDLTLGIGIADTGLKVAAFYVHERLWNRLPFGKAKPPDFQI